LDVGANNNGPVKEGEAHWTIQDEPGAGGSGVINNPVQFTGPDPTHTNEEGETARGIEGRRQRVKLREHPAPTPYIRNVLVGIELKIHPNNLAKDLPGLIGAGATGNLISAISQTVEHMSIFGARKNIQVKDWAMDFKTDGKMLCCGTGNRPPTVSGLKCDGVEGGWDFSLNGHADAVHIHLNEDGFGTWSIGGKSGPAFLDLNDWQMTIRSKYAEQRWQVHPGNYCKR
jgi:hypothetical protein